MMRYEQDRNVFIALNGFDPAELMVVGERIPKREGFGRTGTLPFMAVELLEYCNGQISRRFRHDLVVHVVSGLASIGGRTGALV